MIEDINEVEEFETDDQQLYEHWKIEVDPGQTQVRIDKFLSEKNPYQSRNRIQQAAEAGFIRVNGTPVKSNYKVRPNDVITLVLDVYHGDLGVMTDKDVVLALSNSGQTDELLRFIPMVLHMNVPIISITGNPDSLLAKYSNHHITVKVKKEACPLNLAPTSSTTAALAMGDALAIALMQVRHFKPRDFAQFHPGGELGKRLLTTAEDVMRSDDMPIIPKEMHLGEAIIHVSKGKLGLGISLDEDNHVIGLITDGDIRRAMEKWQAEFFNKTVSDIMTTTPKMVTPKTKISEIQRIMHKYKVHTVLVVDKDNHLKGIVDHYACMV